MYQGRYTLPKLLSNVKNIADESREKAKRFYKPVMALSLIYMVGITTIVRANFYYIDDLGRAYEGYTRFDREGRYVSEWLVKILCADSYVTDISPFTQLLAAVIMAMSAVCILHLITGRDHFSWVEYLAAIPVGLSPYFLECYSYKFDSPFMALSVLASVVPALFAKRGSILYFISVVLGMLVMCMTYQPSSGIFPMLIAIMVLKQWNQGEKLGKILKFAGISAIAYLVGIGCFSAFIVKPFDHGYVSTSIPGVMELIPNTIENLRNYYSVIQYDFKRSWLLLCGGVMIGFLYSMVRESKRNKFLSLLVSFVTLLLLLCMAFGVYPILEKPLFAARSMYGFGILLAILAICGVSGEKHWSSVPVKAICFCLCWCFFSFSFTYGNALNAQKEYEDFRIREVLDDISEHNVLETEKLCYISGGVGLAPQIRRFEENTQSHMIARLVPVLFGDSNWGWAAYKIVHYYGVDKLILDYSGDIKTMELPMVCDCMYHTIYSNDEYIRIELK